MPTYNDSGIVLNSYNFAEFDKILNIYTKQNGLVRAIAKSARKPLSKITSGGKTDKLSCCYFQFAKGKNLDIICDCEQINSFSLLRSDLIRLTYGILFLEVVNSFAHEQESESNHIYDLLYSNLEELQRTSNPALLSISFVTNFLSLHGFKPQLETCVACSKDVLKEVRSPYSSALGGVLCKECAGVVDHKLVDINVLEIIKECGVRNGECGIKNNEYVHLALDLLREHVDMRAKNKVNSFDLVFSL